MRWINILHGLIKSVIKRYQHLYYNWKRLLSIVDNFDHYGRDVDTQSYLDKLQLRTGYNYEGNLDAVSCWGFVHGDLTISNILHNEDFIFIDPRGTEEQDYYDLWKTYAIICNEV